jgi:hypothetical protein
MTGNRFIMFLLAAGALAAAALLAMPVERYDALGWGDVAGPAEAAPMLAPVAPPPPAARTADSAEHGALPRLWLR